MGFQDALAKQAPGGTFRYTFDTITVNCDEPPVLICRFAGDNNPAYKSAVIKFANERRAKGGKLTARKLRDDDELDAKLFATTVVTGWENLHEEASAPCAQCTPEKVEEFLLGLIEARRDLWLGFTRAVRDPENFRDAEHISGVELGKK
jgi:hypothetical protein